MERLVMNKYICLRDDDTNYFTNVQELEEGYEELWGKVPITLATIPFVHGSEKRIMDFDLDKGKYKRLREWELSADYSELSLYNRLFPVGDNHELVYELKRMADQGLIEIAQHGVTHRYNERGAEMFYDNVSFYELRSANEYLEKTFDSRVQIFIPPSNTIDYKSAENIRKLDMRIMSSGTIKLAGFAEKMKLSIQYPYSIIDKIRRKECDQLIKRRGKNIYISSFTLGINTEEQDFMSKVEKIINELGFVAIGTHYRLLQEQSYREKYIRIVNHLSKLESVEFLCATDYYNKIKGRYYA